ncbi:maleylacetoacetate isomerase [Skermanella sp. TT6]|uniref:Maleylacetoacetate isomerase n=1 Tax=Skermanella cutis TaxID=2775420 RepID=A0ABX7B212_9PROT|nr:maleylacetoacetate isomerase [Skermanella sp. TT6]QQP88196.1 maleylacetoacetate isomerase [Skermanella sp. TT6]
MKLFGYFRSSAAYRVRIALNLKGLEVDHRFVHLRKGEQSAPEYGALNPQGMVPLLIDGPHVLTQSLAIIEYLEETNPEPSLLPKHPIERARVRAIAQAIACDIHPLNNLRVLRYLVGPMKASDEAKNEWYRHWVVEGLTALERTLTPAAGTGTFCHGDQPTLADVCLVPQVYNAERADIDLSPFPRIMKIVSACRELRAFQDADPAKQADAE